MLILNLRFTANRRTFSSWSILITSADLVVLYQHNLYCCVLPFVMKWRLPVCWYTAEKRYRLTGEPFRSRLSSSPSKTRPAKNSWIAGGSNLPQLSQLSCAASKSLRSSISSLAFEALESRQTCTQDAITRVSNVVFDATICAAFRRKTNYLRFLCPHFLWSSSGRSSNPISFCHVNQHAQVT